MFLRDCNLGLLCYSYLDRPAVATQLLLWIEKFASLHDYRRAGFAFNVCWQGTAKPSGAIDPFVTLNGLFSCYSLSSQQVKLVFKIVTFGRGSSNVFHCLTLGIQEIHCTSDVEEDSEVSGPGAVCGTQVGYCNHYHW